MNILVVNNYKENERAQRALQNLTRCTGQTLETIDYKTPNLQERVLDQGTDLAILTGSNFMLTKPDTRMVFQQETDMVRKLHVPILGICFGHQLIGTAYGAEVVDLGQTVKDLKDIKVLSRHPVFDGLPDILKVSESHRQGLDRVPMGFHHLAESATSSVEAICHETRPIYSFQFHPERSDEKYPHGRIIIQNVVKLATKF